MTADKKPDYAEKETLLYEKLSSGRVRCNTCQRRCTIEEGHLGWCKTRLNQKGILYTLIYGKVSSWMVSPIEKKPMFHYYPGSRWLSLGTFGCNFRCPGCQNWEISHTRMDMNIRDYSYISPEECVNLAEKYDCFGISWTYNEPTIWFEYTLETAKLVKSPLSTHHSLLTNYVTNGFITPEALDTIGPYLDSFRVDIKGFSKKTYQKIAHIPDFTPLEKTIPKFRSGRNRAIAENSLTGFTGILGVTKRAKDKWNMHIEIVTNVIPTVNDDKSELTDLANWIKTDLGENTPWHVTRFIPYFHPVRNSVLSNGVEWADLPVTPVKTLEQAREIGLNTGLRYVYLGNVPGHPAENTYCPNCHKLLIERNGISITDYQLKGNHCPDCQTVISGHFPVLPRFKSL
mgnify:CR=1 FL=1